MSTSARNTKNRNNCLVLFEYKQETPIELVVLDTETTGIDASEDYIVEFSAKKYRMEAGQMIQIDEMDQFIRPPMPMSESVIAIHGITNEFLEDKPTEEEAFGEIAAFLGEKPLIAGYNVSFDVGMIEAMYARNNAALTPRFCIDVLEMARDLVNYKETDNYKLGVIAELYGVDAGLTFHSAIDDVEATARLLSCFYEEYKKLPKRTATAVPYINYCAFWKGFNKMQAGLSVNTSEGRIWYSNAYKRWMSSEVDLEQIDIDKFEEQVLARVRLNLTDLGKLTEKKFQELKAKRRLEGARV